MILFEFFISLSISSSDDSWNLIRCKWKDPSSFSNFVMVWIASHCPRAIFLGLLWRSACRYSFWTHHSNFLTTIVQISYLRLQNRLHCIRNTHASVGFVPKTSIWPNLKEIALRIWVFSKCNRTADAVCWYGKVRVDKAPEVIFEEACV